MKPRQIRDGKKKSITASDVTLMFAVCFVVFFLVGYLRGRSDRNTPARLKLYLAEIIKKDKGLLELGKDSNGKRIIKYTCPNHQYWYTVDDRKPHIDPLNTSPAAGQSYELAITKDSTFYETFVVGTISAWSIKDLFRYFSAGENEATADGRVKQLIAAIAGSLIGYELGYWLATRTPPACDSAKYDDLLQDQKQWHSIAKGAWEERFSDLYKGTAGLSGCSATDPSVRRLQEDILSKALTQLAHLKDPASEVNHEYSSADFDGLDDFAKVRTEYLKQCGSGNIEGTYSR